MCWEEPTTAERDLLGLCMSHSHDPLLWRPSGLKNKANGGTFSKASDSPLGRGLTDVSYFAESLTEGSRDYGGYMQFLKCQVSLCDDINCITLTSHRITLTDLRFGSYTSSS